MPSNVGLALLDEGVELAHLLQRLGIGNGVGEDETLREGDRYAIPKSEKTL